jgi:hypothetical protein
VEILRYYISQFLYVLTYPLRMLVYAPQHMFSGMGRLRRISLPARVAILTAVFLIICVAVAVVIFVKSDLRPWEGVKLGWQFWTVITVLVVVIPIVLYKALKLWLEGDVSPFPDIDHAWRAGLAELDRQGLSLSEIPLFLVLGTAGVEHEKALFGASRLNFNVAEVPTGPSPLHWYANADGAYLVCAEASSLSTLAILGRETVAEEKSKRGPTPAPRPAGGANIRGTFAVGASGDDRSDPVAAAPAPVADIRGTMAIGGTGGLGGDVAAETPSAGRRVVKLDQKEAAEQARRLEYLCRLILRVRQPLCPINGVLTLLPFGLIQRSVAESREVQNAVKRDLNSLVRVLMLRCPVTAMVTGLEEEIGFQELVRRVGRDAAMRQRFGKGFNVQNPPLPERLDALATHACGAFEDWVYALFREKKALAKPGNTKLYALLCNIRRNVRSRLANLMVAGYARDSDADAKGEPLMFGGCYFAATGETEDRQAFVKNVFDKLPEQQEELQWTEAAYAQDEKFQRLARLALTFDTLLLATLVALVWYKFW